MLYTFSQADYAQRELEGYFANITENDAVVLWQDGVCSQLNIRIVLNNAQLNVCC